MSTPYTLATTSNRLASVGGIARSYDFSGNQTGDGASAFTYDDRGRLVGVTTPLGSVTYAVNALGQRVRKTAGAITTYFAYDLSGRLIGEYDGTGAPIQEVSWLGDTPVATMRPNGTGFDIFPIWTDHLNTPRMVTNMAGQVRWEWANADPFGANAANDNPAGLGAFAFNLRFPGQYFDQETGTHYNYFRDYDPSIGRYVQSDPLGINAGLNTYAYVTSNPLAFSDPEGLNPLIARGLAAALAAARAAKVAIEKSYNYCKNIRCRIAIHDAHHQFGWPFNRKMCHVQLNCWTKGVRGSGFALRFPYPCSWPGAGGAAGAGAGAGLGPDEQGEGDEQ